MALFFLYGGILVALFTSFFMSVKELLTTIQGWMALIGYILVFILVIGLFIQSGKRIGLWRK